MTEAVATYRYTLTWQDGLAYERLPKGLTGLQTITLYLWLGLAGFVVIALPPEIAGEINTPRFWLTAAGLVVLQYVIFWLARGIRRLNRARYRYPHDVAMTVSQLSDRLLVDTASGQMTVPYEEIGALLPTAERLFIAFGRELVIVPATAFAGGDGMQGFIDRIDGYMREQREAAQS